MFRVPNTFEIFIDGDGIEWAVQWLNDRLFLEDFKNLCFKCSESFWIGLNLVPLDGSAKRHHVGYARNAAKLSFEHPRTGKRMRFESPVPDDFQQALRALGSKQNFVSGGNK